MERHGQSSALSRRTALKGGVAITALAALAKLPHRAQAQSTPRADGGWTFTDDRGVTVTLPKRPERIVAQVAAAASLWDYGIRPVAVFGPHLREDGTQDPQSGEVDLETVETLGNIWGEFDLEKFFALEPDLLVAEYYDPAALWYVPAEALEAIEERGIATIGFLAQDAPVDQFIGRFAELAAALGADLESPDNAAAIAAYAESETALKSAIAGNPGLTVLFLAAGPDMIYVANPTVARDLIYYANLGLAIAGLTDTEFWDALSWERVNKYPVDLIFNDARSQSLQPDQLAEYPAWNSVPAVQAGQVAPWYSETTFSHKGYAAVLDSMTAAIANARADVV